VTTGPIPTEVAAWVAGYLDGEGCFTTNSLSSILVDVSNTHLPSLERLKALFGGTIRLKSSTSPAAWRRAYSWRVHGEKAERLIHTIRPFLREKQGQADLLLEFRRTTSKEVRGMIKEALRRAKRPEF